MKIHRSGMALLSIAFLFTACNPSEKAFTPDAPEMAAIQGPISGNKAYNVVWNTLVTCGPSTPVNATLNYFNPGTVSGYTTVTDQHCNLLAVAADPVLCQIRVLKAFSGGGSQLFVAAPTGALLSSAQLFFNGNPFTANEMEYDASGNLYLTDNVNLLKIPAGSITGSSINVTYVGPLFTTSAVRRVALVRNGTAMQIVWEGNDKPSLTQVASLNTATGATTLLYTAPRQGGTALYDIGAYYHNGTLYLGKNNKMYMVTPAGQTTLGSIHTGTYPEFTFYPCN